MWRNNTRNNEEMEPKRKQHPVVDVTGDGSKVQYYKEHYCKVTWCQSPAPAARKSAWRDERCWRKMMQPLTQGVGLHVYFKFQVLFYTLTKALGQRFDIFSSPPTQIYCLQKSLLPFKQSSCFSNSLRIVFTGDYIVTHAYVWAAYHIPQFISYLSKSCLPLIS